jgi:hypothetical protein
MTGQVTTRWLCYCRERHVSPDAHWSAITGMEYSLWLGERWREWDTNHGITHTRPRTWDEHAAFDSWLEGRCEAQEVTA